MAFNWQTFRTRTLTAAIFVAVMLTGLLWNQWSFLDIIFYYSFWLLVGVLQTRWRKFINTTFHPLYQIGFYGTGLWIDVMVLRS